MFFLQNHILVCYFEFALTQLLREWITFNLGTLGILGTLGTLGTFL
jgi:hypothetical protein